MSHPAGPVRSFGPFRYDPEQRLLFRAGAIVPLVPKAIDTLHILLERHGRVVEKHELMQLVWPDTVVEEVGWADGMRRPVSPGGCDMLPGRRTPVGANKETSHEEDYHCFVAVRAAEDKPDQTRWQGDAA